MERRSVAARQEWRCALCGRLFSAHFEVDHVVSLAGGGADAMPNLQALCSDCHREKTVSDNRRALAIACGESHYRCLKCDRCISTYFTHRCIYARK